MHSTEPVTEEDFESEVRTILVTTVLHGQRLDKCLAQCMPEFSRAYLQMLIAQGDVAESQGVMSKASSKVQAGQVIRIILRPTQQAQSFQPEPVALDVVFEDAHVLVINKRAGLVVHPAAGNWTGTLLNGLLMRNKEAAELPRAGIVHRLDKDTSGLMMVGKTRTAVDALSRQIANRSVNRYYVAMAETAWKPLGNLVSVDQPIGRDSNNRIRMAVTHAAQNSGKQAKTMFRLLDEGSKFCLLACKLFTGRTHQIRVHLSWLSHPIVGDIVYGGRVTDHLKRQALHAAQLDFLHPISNQQMSFSLDLPEDMQRGLSMVGLQYNKRLFDPSFFGHPPS